MRDAVNRLLVVVLIAFVVCGGVVRFSHPELTETQLLLRYWYIWTATGAVALCVAVRVGHKEGDDDDTTK